MGAINSGTGRGVRCAVAVALAAMAFMATQTSAHAATETFNYTGNVQSWTVPIGVTQATFTLTGARGGGNGGAGGTTVGTLSVSHPQRIELWVGGQGTSCSRGETDPTSCTAAGGFNGGGSAGIPAGGGLRLSGGSGGGATDVRICGSTGPCGLGSRVLVAGGGGGGGGDSSATISSDCGPGGQGGGATGDRGALSCGGAAGKGGTQTAGGESGFGGSVNGDGVLGIGGQGSGGAGGGGGGLFGGGGGGVQFSRPTGETTYGAAGGGSGLCGASASGCTTTNGGGNGNGRVVITYTQAVADVSITKTDSADPVLLGQSFDYNITVSNAGPLAVTAANVFDTLPAQVTYNDAASDSRCNALGPGVQCQLGAIPVGGQEVIKIRVTANAVANPATNRVEVAAAQPDADTSDNTDTEQTTIVPAADVSITKTDSADPVFVGQDFTYSLTVANAGPSTATGVSVLDLLPDEVAYDDEASDPACDEFEPGTVGCLLSDIGPGSQTVVEIGVTATATTASTFNFASVTADESDPDQIDNNALAETTIIARPSCNGSPATLVGNGTVTGTSGNDVIVGGAGNDRIRGRGGHDVICGGDGADRVLGDKGSDQLYGELGNDRLDGGDGTHADLLDGGGGDADRAIYTERTEGLSLTLDEAVNDGAPGEGDLLTGIERIYGGQGADTIVGDDLDNYLIGGPGADTMLGQDGHDRLRAQNSDADSDLDCGAGKDRVELDAELDPAPVDCERIE